MIRLSYLIFISFSFFCNLKQFSLIVQEIIGYSFAAFSYSWIELLPFEQDNYSLKNRNEFTSPMILKQLYKQNFRMQVRITE